MGYLTVIWDVPTWLSLIYSFVLVLCCIAANVSKGPVIIDDSVPARMTRSALSRLQPTPIQPDSCQERIKQDNNDSGTADCCLITVRPVRL